MPVRRDVKSLLKFILGTIAILILFIVSMRIHFGATLVMTSFLIISGIGLIVAYHVFKDML